MHEQPRVIEIDTWTGIAADAMWHMLGQELAEFFRTFEGDAGEWCAILRTRVKASSHRKQHVWVLLDEDVAMGFLALRSSPTETEVRAFYLHPQRRNLESGRMLFSGAFATLEPDSHLRNIAFTFPEDYLTPQLRLAGYATVLRHNLVMDPLQVAGSPELGELKLDTIREESLEAMASVGHLAYQSSPDLKISPEKWTVDRCLQDLQRQWGEHLDRESSVSVKDTHGDVVGFCLVENGGDEGESLIQDVVVVPSQRGRGVARAMMLVAIGRLINARRTRAVLTVSEDNPGPLSLYQHLGFRHYSSYPEVIETDCGWLSKASAAT
jgi:ribosomal protein S18 acetylase RimI-like enzyme